MNNCLVTKLAASVENADLPKLGVIRLALRANKSASNLLSGVAGKDAVLSLVSGSVTITDYSSGDVIPLPWEMTVSDSWRTVTTGGEGAIVEISGKYDGVSSLSAILQAAEEIDLSVFSYMQELTDILFDTNAGVTVRGDISSLASCQKLTTLRLRSGNTYNYTGIIESLGPCTALTFIDSYLQPLSGELVNLAKRQRASGRTEGSINFGWLDEKITFNGTPCNKRDSSTLSWTASTISWDGTTINE